MIKVGDLIPIGAVGNAKPSEVSKGKTYSSDEGVDLVGTMPQYTNYDKTISNVDEVITIPKGEQTREFRVRTDIEEGYKEGDILDGEHLMEVQKGKLEKTFIYLKGQVEDEEGYTSGLTPVISTEDGVLFCRRGRFVNYDDVYKFYFFDNDMNLLWSKDPDNKYDTATPRCVDCYDGHIILYHSSRVISKIKATTGKIIWSIENNATSMFFDTISKSFIFNTTFNSSGSLHIFTSEGIQRLSSYDDAIKRGFIGGVVVGHAVIYGQYIKIINISTGELGYLRNDSDGMVNNYCIKDSDNLWITETTNIVALQRATLEDIDGTPYLVLSTIDAIIKPALTKDSFKLASGDRYLKNNMLPFMSKVDGNIAGESLVQNKGVGFIEVIGNERLELFMPVNDLYTSGNNVLFNGVGFFAGSSSSDLNKVTYYKIIKEKYTIKKGRG